MTITIFGTPDELTDFFKMMASDVVYTEEDGDEEDGGDEEEDGDEEKEDGGEEKFNEFAPEV